jgi:hypothetical protein
MKRYPALFLAALMTLCESAPLVPVATAVATSILFTPTSSQALPRGRVVVRPAVRPVYHPVARATTVRGVARRTTRRVARRHMWALPGAYAPYRWGAYTYFLCAGVYYYPYMYGGRTVYVEVDVDSSGKPLPPPSASQVSVDIDIDIDD